MMSSKPRSVVSMDRFRSPLSEHLHQPRPQPRILGGAIERAPDLVLKRAIVAVEVRRLILDDGDDDQQLATRQAPVEREAPVRSRADIWRRHGQPPVLPEADGIGDDELDRAQPNRLVVAGTALVV